MIAYPYLPEGRTHVYVGANDQFMLLAKTFARSKSLDTTMPGAAVVVAGYDMLGIGANGSAYHESNACRRVVLGCKSGEGYELCEGCHPRNHSEPSAIRNARDSGFDVAGADLYLWGHWWCCQACWKVMIKSGINRVILLEGSEKLFNKEHPENIVGRQFEDFDR